MEEALPAFADFVREFGLFAVESCSCNLQLRADGGLRCDCADCGRWRDFVSGVSAPVSFCPARPRYEVLTCEFVDALADYLKSRLSPGELLLEVGSGDGRLAEALRRRLPTSIKLIATDSGTSGLKPQCLVEQRDAEEAVASLTPSLVLSAWMPLGLDWTPSFRATDSVREYVLVGDPEICGFSPWETWGQDCGSDTAPGTSSCSEEENMRPYEVEGWLRVPLPEVARYQIARTDERWSNRRHSTSVAFRRGGARKRGRDHCVEEASSGKRQKSDTSVRQQVGGSAWPSSDTAYFEKYDSAFVHEEMLRDGVRCGAYAEAIAASQGFLRDAVVIDVGAGSGVLSCLCARAGARKVYAIEASAPTAQLCRDVVLANGFGNVIEVIQARAEDVELPDGTQADAIVSEWMGFCLLYESMLDSVLLARDRWLRPGGLMLPSRARLLLCPFSDAEWRQHRQDLLIDVCGLDLSALLPRLSAEEASEPAIQGITTDQLLAEPQCVLEFDLAKVNTADICRQSARLSWPASEAAAAVEEKTVHGYAAWFDVFFEPPAWSAHSLLAAPSLAARFVAAGATDEKRGPMLKSTTALQALRPTSRVVALRTGPDQPRTCWHQTLLYLPSDASLKTCKSNLHAQITLTRPAENPRYLRVEIESTWEDSEVEAGSAFKEVRRHRWLLRSYAPEGTRGPPLPVARVRGTARAACYGGAR